MREINKHLKLLWVYIGAFVLLAFMISVIIFFSFGKEKIMDENEKTLIQNQQENYASDEEASNNANENLLESDEDANETNQSMEIYEENKEVKTEVLSETEWILLKQSVYLHVLKGEINEAMELIYQSTLNVNRDKLSFKNELTELELDILDLAIIQDTSHHKHLEGEADDQQKIHIAKNMHSPELSLIAFMGLTHKEKVYTILHQSSLAPYINEVIHFSDFYDYNEEFVEQIKATYGKETKVVATDIEVEGNPLQMILISAKDNTYQVWRIVEKKEGSTYYQDVEYWKDFFQKTNKGGHSF